MYYFRGVHNTMKEGRSTILIKQIRRRRILRRRATFLKLLHPSIGTPGEPRPASNESSQYHPSPILGDKLPETEEDEKKVDQESLAGSSRQPGPSILRYSQFNTQSTDIHGPKVLVHGPPFPPYTPFFSHSSHNPPGNVCPRLPYVHPRPPTPYPPSPSPPPLPPTPRPAVYQAVPDAPAAPAFPAAQAVPPLPWWNMLLNGPNNIAAVELFNRYITVLEYLVNNYM